VSEVFDLPRPEPASARLDRPPGLRGGRLHCRGPGPQRTRGEGEHTGGVTGWTDRGYVIRGLMDDPRAAYYRQVFLDAKRLADMALALPNVDPSRVGAIGGSQGGGLTVAAAALDPRITHIAPMMPCLSDYRRVWEM